MGPRPSISGELPIDSYFNSAGATGNKKNGSTKRRTGASADDTSANRTQIKKRRTRDSKGTNLEVQEKSRSGSAEVRPKAVKGVFGTTSIPTPISVAKLPRPTSSRVSADMEVIMVTSSSPPRATLLDSGDAMCTARNAASGSSLPTPQTVSHEAKKKLGTVPAVPLPMMATVSRSVTNSGPAIPSVPPRPPVTPSRPRIKHDNIPLVYRTTPHSQRIVPSSQLLDDEQPNSASSLEGNRDPFLLRLSEEPSSFPDELTLPPSSDVPSQSFSTSPLTSVKLRVSAYPTLVELVSGQECSLENNLDSGNTEDARTRPLFLSGAPRSVLLSSNGLGPWDLGQGSQIEPTSQVEEIELKVPSQRLFVDPIASSQTNNRDVVPSVERSQTGPLQDRSSHSEAIVEQESSSTDHCHKPSPPPSPLTPLSSFSSLLSDAMGTIGANWSSSQHALPKSLESPAPRSSSEPMVDLGMGETSRLRIENPTSREGGNTLVHASPVRQCPPSASIRSTTFPTDNSPSPGARPHPRILHAKLRGLPDATVELDSEGEEMMSPATSFSLPATSQEMSSASSCLDLVGTLPSEVGDFLDMVDAYTFSEA